MPPRAIWKGYLKLSLVSIPVNAYTASASGGGEIHLNQLHDDCHSRIRYVKTCPIHGEVDNSDIVSGYEFSKGQYVVVEPEELEHLWSEADKSIEVDAFIPASSIDPVYYSGKTYYLVPEDPIGQKPYALIRDCMQSEQLNAVAQVVISGKEQLVLVRAVEQLLAMEVLHYDTQIKHPAAFEDGLPTPKLTKSETTMAKTLISALIQKKFDITRYKDEYTDRLTQLIEAKVEGRELVTPPAEEERPIINLMEALKQSVARVKQPSAARKTTAKKTPTRKMEASTRKRSTTKRKRKSG